MILVAWRVSDIIGQCVGLLPVGLKCIMASLLVHHLLDRYASALLNHQQNGLQFAIVSYHQKSAFRRKQPGYCLELKTGKHDYEML